MIGFDSVIKKIRMVLFSEEYQGNMVSLRKSNHRSMITFRKWSFFSLVMVVVVVVVVGGGSFFGVGGWCVAMKTFLLPSLFFFSFGKS